MNKKQAIFIFITLILIGAVVSGIYINSDSKAEDGKIGVVVTILPQADFVEKVGGDEVHVTVMVPPGASPHTYEPTPSQMKEVSKAKIYFKVGSGVEFENVWMDKIIEMNKDMLIIDSSKDIEKIGKDPHIWNSPVKAKKMVENFCEGLIKIDLNNKDIYLQKKDNYIKELDDVDKFIHERLDNFSNRNFLIYHPSFGYFAKEYHLTQIPVEHEGKEPTPQVIQDCIDKAKLYNLSYVYVAPQFATVNAETIANEIDGETIFIDPLSRDYVSNMRNVAASICLEME